MLALFDSYPAEWEGIALILGGVGILMAIPTLLWMVLGQPHVDVIWEVNRQDDEARQQIGYVPEHPDLTPYASIQEVLLLVCWLLEVRPV